MLEVSVILPTHAPRPQRITRTLAGLQAQTLPFDQWELLVIDNASPEPKSVSELDLSWHPSVRRLQEPQLGLTPARLCGIRHARAELLVFVDDDNVLARDYLELALTTARNEPHFGAFGGRAFPDWESPPPDWTKPLHAFLALRDFGEKIQHQGGHEFGPEFTPNGAGMVVRTAVGRRYTQQLERDGERLRLDRTGRNLASHGDLDLAWTSFALGLEVAYVPALSLRHIIPAQRLTRDYLGRLMYGMARSGIFFQAARSNLPPARPPKFVALRKLRQYFLHNAALSKAGYVRWRYYCGLVDGQHDWHAKANRASQ